MDTETIENMLTHATKAADLLRHLSNEHRLLICCMLASNEMSVGELNGTVPLSQSALSQHLAKLRSAGILTTRKEAQTVYYSLASEAVIEVIGVLQKVFCPPDGSTEMNNVID